MGDVGRGSKERPRGWGVWLALILAAVPLERLEALALRGSAAELVLGDLKIGRSYELVDILKQPLGVFNSGTEPARIVMRVGIPGDVELRDGYEPVPGESWIRLTNRGQEVRPGQEARSNGVITIPKDRSLLGGQYQAQWVSSAVSTSGLRLDLRARILLQIAPDERELEKARRRARKRPGLAFRVAGGDRSLRAPLGQRMELKEHGVSLKLVNPNEKAVSFSLRPSREVSGRAPGMEYFEPAPNPGFLELDREVVEVAGNSVGEARMYLKIPEQKRYRGRRWVFAVAVELLEAEGAAMAEYRLYVETW